jgi:hypothetical protein
MPMNERYIRFFEAMLPSAARTSSSVRPSPMASSRVLRIAAGTTVAINSPSDVHPSSPSIAFWSAAPGPIWRRENGMVSVCALLMNRVSREKEI